MTRFILLKDRPSGNYIEVNPHHIATMNVASPAGSLITLANGEILLVMEGPADIKEKIEALDYSRCVVEYVAMKGVSPLKLNNAAVAKDGRLHREPDAKPWVSLNRTMFGAEVAIRSSGDAERDSDISSRCHDFMRRVAP